LRSLIRILRASLVQIDTEMAEKYSNQRYEVDALSTNIQMSNTAMNSSRIAFLSTPPAFDVSVRGVSVGISPPRLVWKN